MQRVICEGRRCFTWNMDAARSSVVVARAGFEGPAVSRRLWYLPQRRPDRQPASGAADHMAELDAAATWLETTGPSAGGVSR